MLIINKTTFFFPNVFFFFFSSFPSRPPKSEHSMPPLSARKTKSNPQRTSKPDNSYITNPQMNLHKQQIYSTTLVVKILVYTP